jgi:hypothetical protein
MKKGILTLSVLMCLFGCGEIEVDKQKVDDATQKVDNVKKTVESGMKTAEDTRKGIDELLAKGASLKEKVDAAAANITDWDKLSKDVAKKVESSGEVSRDALMYVQIAAASTSQEVLTKAKPALESVAKTVTDPGVKERLQGIFESKVRTAEGASKQYWQDLLNMIPKS